MFETPLAYKYVSVMLLVSNINYYVPRMGLPINIPVQRQDVRSVSVLPPSLGAFMGAIQVKNFRFLFGEKDFTILNLDQYGRQSLGVDIGRNESFVSGMERASNMKYTVGTNDIYGKATNWLVALDFDVSRLEKANPPSIAKYPTFSSSRGPVPSPLLEVDWHNPKTEGYDPTEVKVQISAVSGELLQFEDAGGYFRKVVPPKIKDASKLVAISDAEFLRYSTLERSNLLVRFAGLHCSDMHCPGLDEPLLHTQTNSVSRTSP
jgi:hypothetical protein